MQFDERLEGGYHIYAGALEAPRGGGYIAAVVVERVHGAHAAREVWRDDSLACGYRWPSAGDALDYALDKASELIRTQSKVLAC